MSETIFLLTLGLPLATVLLIFGMRYGSRVLQAQAGARRAVADQTILTELADIKARLLAIEKLLKDID